MQVRRDRGLINLQCVDDPVIDPARRDRKSLLSADMSVETLMRSSSSSLSFRRRALYFFKRSGGSPAAPKPSSSKTRTAISCCSPPRLTDLFDIQWLGSLRLGRRIERDLFDPRFGLPQQVLAAPLKDFAALVDGDGF